MRVLLLLAACGRPPMERMAPCPASPNCVSSHATDAGHAIPPFTAADPGKALAELVAAAQRVDGFTTLVVHDADYVHATFTTPMLRFVDDLELQLGERSVHVRSASRLGYGDHGVNRARVEALRAAWGTEPSTPGAP